MDEKPKNIWKKSWRGRDAIFILSLPIILAVLLATLIYALANWAKPVADTFVTAVLAEIIFVTCVLFIVYVVRPLLRWLFWKDRRRTFFVFACFATSIALFYAEEDWRGWHAWQKYKHEWEAKGEHFDCASIIPPCVPEDQNFALTPIVFTSYGSMLTRDGKMIPQDKRDKNFVVRLQMPVVADYSDWPSNGGGIWAKATLTDLKPWQAYYRQLDATKNMFPVAPQPQTPAQDVLLALGKYDPTIEELREASKLPYSRFPLEYDKDNPAEILLPHLAVMKGCVQILRLRAIAELQNGESGKALDDVKLMLYLNQSIRSEPILISHLVRLAMAEITLQPVYEGLAEHKWSDTQLAALDAELGKLDFMADFEFSMRGERVFGISVTEYLRRSRNLRAMGFDGQGDPSSPLFSDLGFHLAPASFFYLSELTIARVHQQWVLPLVDVENRTVSPNVVRRSQIAGQKELEHGWPYNILARMVFPSIQNAVIKFARGQSSLDLARAAVALERYRLVHGGLPESIDVLAPQFIEKVPHDIINGQPLKYRRTSDGQFVLYSVGWNETGDGGVVVNQKSRDPRDESSSKVDISQGDWVWRYPKAE
jgi:hypothetical protein